MHAGYTDNRVTEQVLVLQDSPECVRRVGVDVIDCAAEGVLPANRAAVGRYDEACRASATMVVCGQRVLEPFTVSLHGVEVEGIENRISADVRARRIRCQDVGVMLPRWIAR